MAVVMMGGDKNNPMFHDFLGMSSGDGDDNGSPAVNKGGEREMDGEISAGISSERAGTNNSEVFHFHGTKNVISEPEASNALSGRKRSSSSSYMSLIREKMLSLGSDSLESSCLMKTFGKSHDEDEMPCSIQLPPRSASSLLLHPPLVGRPDALISKWDRSPPVNPGIMGQSGANINKFSLSCSYKDVNVGATLIPQAAADEGSRTGMRGSGILNIINSSSSGACELKTAGSLPYTNRSKAPQIVQPESSNVPGRYNLASSTRQMTIFYAGQAHVFDDVHPNKADVIMALAGSSGVSWTTDCSLKPGVSPPIKAITPRKENELPINNNFRVPDRGLVSRVSRIPLTNDLQSLTPGVHQGDRAGREAVEPDRDSKKDAR